MHHRRVGSRHAISERLGAVCGGDACGIEQILDAVRDAVQRTTISAGGNFRIGLFRPLECDFLREGNDRPQLRIELRDPLQIDVRQAFG